MKSILIQKVKTTDIPHLLLNIGDTLITTLTVDVLVSITNSHIIRDIEADGTIRIECINKCPKIECTYLNLYDYEIKRLKIDNTITETKRMSVSII